MTPPPVKRQDKETIPTPERKVTARIDVTPVIDDRDYDNRDGTGFARKPLYYRWEVVVTHPRNSWKRTELIRPVYNRNDDPDERQGEHKSFATALEQAIDVAKKRVDELEKYYNAPSFTTTIERELNE